MQRTTLVLLFLAGPSEHRIVNLEDTDKNSR